MNMITIIGLFFTGIGFFLCAFFLLRNRSNADSYLFLYAALGILSYELFYKTLIQSKLIYDFLWLYQPGRFYNVLILPIFLLFVWSIDQRRPSKKYLPTLLISPFLIYSLFTFGKSLSILISEKRHLLDLFYADSRPGPFNYWSNWGTLWKSTLLPIALLGLVAYDFFKLRKSIQNPQNKRLLNFLSATIVFYILFYQFANSIYQLVYRLTNYSMIEWPVDMLFLSLIISFLAIMALSINSGDTFFPPAKYASSALNKQEYSSIVNQLSLLIEKEQLFKVPQISLKELAARLEINTKYVSQAINDHLDLSFTDFINQYRVEDAKQQLIAGQNEKLTIEAIGLNAGFKSKSSFFRAFKKHTGSTPLQYLQSLNTTQE